jgi:cellobiose-specific phosphotransferase system component IIC
MFYSFTALFTLILHHVAAMFFLPFVKCSDRASLPENAERHRKNKGTDAALK